MMDEPTGVSACMRPLKRSFTIRSHRTSISLEAPFWDALQCAATDSNLPIAELVARIDETRGATGLSSAVRLWLLDHYRRRGSSR